MLSWRQLQVLAAHLHPSYMSLLLSFGMSGRGQDYDGTAGSMARTAWVAGDTRMGTVCTPLLHMQPRKTSEPAFI